MSKTVTFASNQSTANCTIPIKNNDVYEKQSINFFCRIVCDRDDVIVLTDIIIITIVDGELVMT